MVNLKVGTDGTLLLFFFFFLVEMKHKKTFHYAVVREQDFYLPTEPWQV